MRFKEINTLFIHIPKTGGTTITYEIAKHLYDVTENIFSLYKDNEKTVVKKSSRKAHTYAKSYRKVLGDEEYNKLYTFSFVREPFSQIASLFYQLNSMNLNVNERFRPYKEMNFEEFIMRNDGYGMVNNLMLIDQVKFLTDLEGNIIVEDIFPFEYFEESLKILSKKLNIPFSTERKFRETNNNLKYTPKMISRVLDFYFHVYKFHKEVKENFEKNVLSKK